MSTKPTSKPPSAVAEHRRRLRSRGLQRVEMQVRAAALIDPEQVSEARALLRRRFGPEPTRNLKGLLAAAPLDDIELTRSRDPARAVDL